MAEITKADYEALLAFRVALRGFLHFAQQGARSVGLTAQQHQVLLAIVGQRGRDRATVGEIAAALYISHNGAVGLVDRCQQLGLVVRVHDEIDRRTVFVSLTDKGKAILDRLSAENLQELRELGAALRFADEP